MTSTALNTTPQLQACSHPLSNLEGCNYLQYAFRKFPKFCELPTEIRQDIWRKAILGAFEYDDEGAIITLEVCKRVIPKSLERRLFNINAEARRESMLLLGRTISMRGLLWEARNVHFSPKIDTLYLNSHLCDETLVRYSSACRVWEKQRGLTAMALREFRSVLTAADRFSIHKLAIEVKMELVSPRYSFYDLLYAERELKSFPNLELVTLVIAIHKHGRRLSPSWHNFMGLRFETASRPPSQLRFIDAPLDTTWIGYYRDEQNTFAVRAGKALESKLDSIKETNPTWQKPRMRVAFVESELRHDECMPRLRPGASSRLSASATNQILNFILVQTQGQP